MADFMKHILVLPFPIFGHITPMLELSKKLSNDYRITFAVSQFKVDEIRSRELLSLDDEMNIRLLGLEDGLGDCDRDLSPRDLAEVIDKINPVQRELLGKMRIYGEPWCSPSLNYLQMDSVDAVISDTCFPVPVLVGKERDFPVCLFACSAGWTLAGMLTVNENTPTCSNEKYYSEDQPEPSDSPEVPVSLKRWLVACNESIHQASAVLINSFEDLEPETKGIMTYISPAIAKVPVLFLGPVVAPLHEKMENTAISQRVLRWLNEQKDRSVLYVSFGSMNIPASEQIREISRTLQALKRPFIWSLRVKQHHHLPVDIREAIFRQFQTTDSPFLILNWAPQKAILDHPATRVFVSHCGWNSVLESIACGVPMVAWPMHVDQRLNAALVVKLGIGLMIPDLCLRGRRIVLQREILETVNLVAGWGHVEFVEGNSYYRTVRVLSRQAEEAVGPMGKSTRDYQKLIEKMTERHMIDREGEHAIRLLPLQDGLTADFDKDLNPTRLIEAITVISAGQKRFFEGLPGENGQLNSHWNQLNSVDCVITDCSFPVPVTVCRQRNIRVCVFSCSAAWTVVGMLAVNPDTPVCADDKFYDGRNCSLNTTEQGYVTSVPESLKTWLVDCSTAMRQADAVIINSFEDLEPNAKSQMAVVSPVAKKIPTYFIGPVLMGESVPRTALAVNEVQKVTYWLDKQADRSVVYVSFGSMAIPVPKQIEEIATALINLKRPFILALRTAQHHLLSTEVRAAISTQFDAASNTPFLILNWSPQTTILGHPATRLFVSHCGWNSTLESITCGVPIVAWPMFADQHLNAALVVKLGIGITISGVCVRGQRIVPHLEIQNAIDRAADWDGKEAGLYYRNVRVLSRSAQMAPGPDGKSTRDLEKVADMALT